MIRRLALGIVMCVLGIAPALAASPVPLLPVPHDAAVILDSGSTNAPGYRVVVQRAGTVRSTVHAGAAQTAALFAALSAGMPLSHLQSGHCMKSASFGTSMFVYWNHQRSPDLTCPADARSKSVFSSVSEFVYGLGIPHRVGLPVNEPRRPLPEATPSAST